MPVTQVSKPIKKIRQLSLVRRQSGGFTIVELTAAAVIIALLASATFVGYARTWQHWALRQNARQLYLTARYARVLAIEGRRPCQLVIDADNRRFYIVRQDEQTETETMVSDVWHRPGQLSESVSFEQVWVVRSDAVGASGSVVTFYPDGRADAATLQVGNGRRSFTVQISAATARASLSADAADAQYADEVDLDTAL